MVKAKKLASPKGGSAKNSSRWSIKVARREYIASGKRTLNQLKAFKEGKNVVFTIKNPIKSETNKPYIRIKAVDLYGGEYSKLPEYQLGKK